MISIRNRFNSGFTIVELLIVIVVIGILATIILVSYTGAQAYANTQSAKSNASSLQRKIEAYAESAGANNQTANSFPDATDAADYTTELNSKGDSALTSSNIIIGTPSASNGTTTVEVSQCSSAIGLAYRIRYWDFSAKALSSNLILGNLGSSTCSSWQVLS